MLERLLFAPLSCTSGSGEGEKNKRIEVIAPSETKKEKRDYTEPWEHFLLSVSPRSVSPRKSSHLG